MAKLLLGWLIGLATAAVVAWVVPFTGLVDMSALGPPGLLDRAGERMFESSAAVRAPDEAHAARPHDGFEHYRESCVLCHGAPGVEPLSFATAMQPRPPTLWRDDTQEEFSDAELFHIIRVGVRMTGMPAFGTEHSDDEIWSIVAFLRNMNNLTNEQRGSLHEAVQQHAHEHASSE